MNVPTTLRSRRRGSQERDLLAPPLKPSSIEVELRPASLAEANNVLAFYGAENFALCSTIGTEYLVAYFADGITVTVWLSGVPGHITSEDPRTPIGSYFADKIEEAKAA